MKKILGVLAVIFVLFSVTASADEWKREDTIRQAAYLTLHTIDWAQTRYIVKNPDKFYETNNILGEHPSMGKVNAYFITTALAHTGIAYVLPSELRKWFQYITIGVEAGVTANNARIGIRASF